MQRAKPSTKRPSCSAFPPPGGPAVEREAEKGDARKVDLPRPLLDRPGLDMSFSGLKTAVRRAAGDGDLSPQRRADICASFQEAVADILVTKAARAMQRFQDDHDGELTFVVAGGVAANRMLRARLEAEARHAGFAFFAPPLRWCTDNAAMIALAGAERLRAGLTDPLDTPARARWPLDSDSAPAYGGGKKGAKARQEPPFSPNLSIASPAKAGVQSHQEPVRTKKVCAALPRKAYGSARAGKILSASVAFVLSSICLLSAAPTSDAELQSPCQRRAVRTRRKAACSFREATI